MYTTKILFSCIALFSLQSCNKDLLTINGHYIDDVNIDKMEVKQIENNHYTVGNKVSQVHLTRIEDELNGVTPLGDSIKMTFFPGDSAHYFIMGTRTTYTKVGPSSTGNK